MSQQSEGEKAQEKVDVLIVAAIKEEYDAVLEVSTGAVSGSAWEERPGPAGFEVAFRTFQAVGGGTLRVAVTRSRSMGGEAAVIAAGLIVQASSPRCLAMCGVCAGRRGDVELGDVIIADRLWRYDTGKVEASRDGSSGPPRIVGDISQYQLNAHWKQAAESFSPDVGSPWVGLRPLTYESQQDWVLERLQAEEDPRKHPDRKQRCADYPQVIEQLWKEGWVEPGKLRLTPQGQERIERLGNQYPEGLPEPKPFKVHLGPIATGSKVVKHPRIFDEISQSVRKVLGVEMEAAAIAQLAHDAQIPYMVVMKGAMDFGDLKKADNFKYFAARASAECLVAFLREYLPPEASLGGDAGALDKLLTPGSVPPPRERSPAALLNAKYQFVDFYRPIRAGLLSELQSWCAGDEPVSVRLFHGAGGMGKTHLFIHWCKELGAQGWRTGFLDKAVEADRFEPLVVASARRPTLVVIDYAESHQGLGALLQVLARFRSVGGKGRFRLVLIAREPGAWWGSLQERSAEMEALLRDWRPTEVAPVAPTGAEREAVFWHAARCFAELLKRELPTRLPTDLEDPLFGRVLYLHMAALATVLGGPFKAETLLAEVLVHEEHFWSTWLETRKQLGSEDGDRRLFQERVRYSVTALTLTGGTQSRQEALDLLERACGARDELLLQLLRDLYPRSGSEAGGWAVGGLEPDLLGEALVLRVLRAEGKGAAGWVKRLLEGVQDAAVRASFEVSGRLSVASTEARGWIAALLEGAVAARAVAALEAAKAVGERTAHSALGQELERALEREGTVEVARKLDASGLPDRAVSLTGVSAWVLTVLLTNLPAGEGTEVMAEKARLLNNLGKFQSELGLRKEALNSAQEAVAIRRTLAQKHPEAFLPDLAGSLNNLGNTQSGLGRREEALNSAQEAVGHYRMLVREHPEAFLPFLAMSLNNLGACQSGLGRREEALNSTQESVSHYRMLVREHPEAFLSFLAMSLNNLANRQSGLGRREEALNSALESVGHYRMLAQKHPEAFLPDLAGSLNNLSKFQSELGRRAEALNSAQESVGHYGTLVLKHPEAFLADLASSLNNLGNRQSELGRMEEALNSTQESVSHYRMLVREHPEAFLPFLAMSLNNLGNRQSGLGRREEALNSALESVGHYRVLAQKHPEAFLSSLAMSLNNLGNIQSELGRREEALSSVQEAVAIRRMLAQKQPEASLPSLAVSLINLGDIQRKLGRMVEALNSTQESVGHYRMLAQKHPEAFLPDLAVGLNNLGGIQSELGRREEALGSAQEAVAIRRTLAQKHPEAFLPDLAGSLNNLGNIQSELGRREEALGLAQEAVGHYRTLAQKHPEAFLLDLAMSLNNLGGIQSELGRRKEALASAQEASDIIWPLLVDRPEAFMHNARIVLSGAFRRHEEAGRAPPVELIERMEFLRRKSTPQS